MNQIAENKVAQTDDISIDEFSQEVMFTELESREEKLVICSTEF